MEFTYDTIQAQMNVHRMFSLRKYSTEVWLNHLTKKLRSAPVEKGEKRVSLVVLAKYR